MNTFGLTIAEASTVTQAAVAATDMTDELLPGGAAISIDAPGLIVAVVDAFNGNHRHQSFVLAVMLSVARWLGSWKRVPDPSAKIEALSAAEVEVRRALRDFVHSHLHGWVSDDPEVRSLFYRLTGMVADPVVAIEYLQQFLAGEESPLARACAYEGQAVAIMRGPAGLRDEILVLRNAVEGDALVASRVANAPYDYVGEGDELNLREVEGILGVRLPDRDYGNFWPSELL